jgi:hypothetical protein
VGRRLRAYPRARMMIRPPPLCVRSRPCHQMPPAPARGREITMPQLGMAQDSGVLVGWLVELGAKVGAEDLLFEVETDKATNGSARRPAAIWPQPWRKPGDEVPVGQAVAVISAEKPENPVARCWTSCTRKPERKPEPAPIQSLPRPSLCSRRRPPRPAGPHSCLAQAAPCGAVEKGLDLARLVQAGHPQPYHMRDLDVAACSSSAATGALWLRRRCGWRRIARKMALPNFADWAALQWACRCRCVAGRNGRGQHGAGGNRGRGPLWQARVYAVPANRRLSAVAPSDAAPICACAICAQRRCAMSHGGRGCAGSDSHQRKGAGLALVLECSPRRWPRSRIALLGPNSQAACTIRCATCFDHRGSDGIHRSLHQRHMAQNGHAV